jgi:hypothetical protein
LITKSAPDGCCNCEADFAITTPARQQRGAKNNDQRQGRGLQGQRGACR